MSEKHPEISDSELSDWSLDRRNAFFADESRNYRAAHPNRNGADENAIPEKEATSSVDGESPSDDREIKRLAKLRPGDYERERKEAAERLGFRTSVLDRLVDAERPGKDKGQGSAFELVDPELWPDPVDGVSLVSEMTAAIRRYVVLDKNFALTAALWVIHSHCFDLFPCTPRLAITAPEKGCGKTTLLDVLTEIVPRSLSTAGISAAATFRTIEACRPTLMIDEADTFLGQETMTCAAS